MQLQHNVLDLRIKDKPRYIISYNNARSKPQNKQSKIYLSQQLPNQKTDMNTEGELKGVVASTETSRGPGSTTRAYGFPSGPRTGHPPTPSTPWTSGVGNSPFYKLQNNTGSKL